MLSSTPHFSSGHLAGASLCLSLYARRSQANQLDRKKRHVEPQKMMAIGWKMMWAPLTKKHSDFLLVPNGFFEGFFLVLFCHWEAVAFQKLSWAVNILHFWSTNLGLVCGLIWGSEIHHVTNSTSFTSTLFAGTTRWSRSARSESLVGQGSGNRGGVSLDSWKTGSDKLTRD